MFLFQKPTCEFFFKYSFVERYETDSKKNLRIFFEPNLINDNYTIHHWPLGGFNNQRQCIFISWLFSYYTRRTFLFENIKATEHDGNEYEFEEIWNKTKISKYIPIKFGNLGDTISPQEEANIIKINQNFKSPKELEDLPKDAHAMYGNYWGFLLHSKFSFLKEKKYADVFNKLMESFEYNDVTHLLSFIHFFLKIDFSHYLTTSSHQGL